MDEKEKTRVIESNLQRQLAWIGSVDSKIAFTMAINTAMLGVLAAISPNSCSEWSIAPVIFASIATLLNIASLIFLTFVTFPRTKGPKGSTIFFAEIAKQDVNQFKQDLIAQTNQQYLEDIISQCHRNAEIANLKYSWMQRALGALYLAILPWGIALYLLYNS